MVVGVGEAVGGEPEVLIVVGSKVRTLPGGCVEAGGALTSGLNTSTKPEEHPQQSGEDQLQDLDTIQSGPRSFRGVFEGSELG